MHAPVSFVSVVRCGVRGVYCRASFATVRKPAVRVRRVVYTDCGFRQPESRDSGWILDKCRTVGPTRPELTCTNK